MMDLRRRRRSTQLADKLRQIRHVLGLSQSELVRQMDENMHYNRISEYELGKREPPLRVLLAYARVAGIHMEHLVDDNLALPAQLPGDVVYPDQVKSTPREK